jgi:hypothetical protein
MGQGGSLPWPPRSPDLNPVDYCLGSCEKLSVHLCR